MNGFYLLLVFNFFYLTSSWCCSIFQIPQTGQVAKNFDWHMGEGELMIRPQGAIKKALDSNLTWVSRYGSVTFNQFGPDLPIGGMNTQGLLIEALILAETKAPLLTQEQRKLSLNEAELIQYALDNFTSVEELLEKLPKLNLKPVHLPIHYFVCDLSHCGVIEYLHGKLVVTAPNKLIHPVLTNLPYGRLLKAYQENKVLGAEGVASSGRFNRLIDNQLNSESELEILQKLNLVKMGSLTVWQILYHPRERTIALKHPFSPKIVRVNLQQLDFNCEPELMSLNFEDNARDFSNENLAPKLIQRSHELSRVNFDTLNNLSSRKLKNNCRP